MRHRKVSEVIPRLDGWSVTTYLGHGLFSGSFALVGAVSGHPDPRHHDGKRIITSAVLSFEGRVVTTRSRRYRVGRIDPAYRRWLRENRPGWDWRRPFTVLDESVPEKIERFCRERAPLVVAAVAEAVAGSRGRGREVNA